MVIERAWVCYVCVWISYVSSKLGIDVVFSALQIPEAREKIDSGEEDCKNSEVTVIECKFRDSKAVVVDQVCVMRYDQLS